MKNMFLCSKKKKRKKLIKKNMKILLKAQQGELDAVAMYNALADKVKDENDAKVFKQLAAEEGGHASVFQKLTENSKLKPKKTKAIAVPMLYKFAGKKICYPLIAIGEYNAVRLYRPVAKKFPEVKSVKNDEKRHGDTVRALLK